MTTHHSFKLQIASQESSLFFTLPLELRLQIYATLLISKDTREPPVTYGRDSGISTAILSTCQSIYYEAWLYLYDCKHTLFYNNFLAGEPCDRCARSGDLNKIWTCNQKDSGHEPDVRWRRAPETRPPLAELRDVQLVFRFHPSVRGDCEVYLPGAPDLRAYTETILEQVSHWDDHHSGKSGDCIENEHATTLTMFRRCGKSTCKQIRLRSMHLELENLCQRKRGKTRLRTDMMRQHIRSIMLPLAFVPPASAKLSVGGFDTMDYVEEFDAMRALFKGSGSIAYSSKWIDVYMYGSESGGLEQELLTLMAETKAHR